MVDFNAYYLLTIVVIACGSIPKGESAPSAPQPIVRSGRVTAYATVICHLLHRKPFSSSVRGVHVHV